MLITFNRILILHRLLCSSDVLVPGTKTKIYDRAFQVTGPRCTWNSLPATIRETKTLPAFKKQLKLYLIGNPEY